MMIGTELLESKLLLGNNKVHAIFGNANVSGPACTYNIIGAVF